MTTERRLATQNLVQANLISASQQLCGYNEKTEKFLTVEKVTRGHN